MVPKREYSGGRILIMAQSVRTQDDAARLIGDRISAALDELVDLDDRGPARDRLWLELWDGITTRHVAYVRPCGATRSVKVTAQDASAEVLAAWDWIYRHEARARSLPGDELYRTLRGAATRSHRGSGRAALADAVCGLTHVPSGTWIAIDGEDFLERRAS
jgi:hypothetical protein